MSAHVQINIRQAVMMLATSLTAVGHLLFVRTVFHYAGRDGWISLSLAILTGLASMLLVVWLVYRLPGQNLADMSMALLGPVVGRAVGLIFVYNFVHLNAMQLRNFADFTRLGMPLTPMSVVLVIMLALVAYAGKKGIEVVARVNDTALPILVVIGILASILLTKEKHGHYLLPVLENGWGPVLQGTIAVQGLLAQTVIFGMFGPCLRRTARPPYPALWAVVAVGLFFIGPIIGAPAMYGIETVRTMTYPTFEQIKQIEIAEFLANLDVLGVLLWTVGSFIRSALLLWASASALASVANLRDYRPLISPLALITGLMAVWLGRNRVELEAFLTGPNLVYQIAMGVLLPLVLLLWAMIRPPRHRVTRLSQK